MQATCISNPAPVKFKQWNSLFKTIDALKHAICNFILILFLFVIGQCNATSAPADTIHLKGVVVTGRRPVLAERSPLPMQIIEGLRLTQMSGYSAAEALRGFAGVTLRDYGGIGGLKTVRVRGLGGGHTGVFIDGMPLNDAATGQADLSRVPLQGLERISLHIGQPSSLLQPARYFASASIVELNTTQLGDANKREFSAGMRTGSFGLLNPYLNLHTKLNANYHTSMNISFTDAHGRYPYNLPSGEQPQTTVLRENSDVQILNLAFALRRNLKPYQTLTLRARYYDSERGLPGAVILYNPFASQRIWNRDIHINLQYEHSRPNRAGMLSGISFSRTRLRYLDPDFLDYDGVLESLYNQHELYITNAFTYPLNNRITLALASDFLTQHLDANLPLFAYPDRYTWLTNLAIEGDFNRLLTQAGLLTTIVREQTKYGDTGNPQNRVTPFASISYLFSDKEPSARIRLMYKNIFRMPTFNELYYSMVGNPNVRPEIAHQFNGGITTSWNLGGTTRISGSVDAFYNRVTDKIVTIPTKNLFVWSVLNFGKADIRGLEWQLQLEHDVSKHASVAAFFNYTFQRAVDVTSSERATYQHQLPYLPRETFSSKGSFTYKNFMLGYSSLFNGHRFALNENIFENMLPSWWHHDVFISWKFQLYQANIQIRAEINNFLDRQYEVIRSFPMPGRGYFIRLQISF